MSLIGNQRNISVNKGCEVYNRSMKSWLPDNDVEIYLIQNKGESIVSERLVRILKKKICNYLIILVKLCMSIN